MNTPPSFDIDRLRGWTMTALYGAIAGLAALLIYATWRLWPADQQAVPWAYVVVIFGLATCAFGLKTCVRYIQIMRSGAGIPRVVLMPFVCITITLLGASQLFSQL